MWQVAVPILQPSTSHNIHTMSSLNKKVRFNQFRSQFKEVHAQCWDPTTPGNFKCKCADLRDPQAHLCFMNSMASIEKYSILMTTLSTLLKLTDTLKKRVEEKSCEKCCKMLMVCENCEKSGGNNCGQCTFNTVSLESTLIADDLGKKLSLSK